MTRQLAIGVLSGIALLVVGYQLFVHEAEVVAYWLVLLSVVAALFLARSWAWRVIALSAAVTVVAAVAAAGVLLLLVPGG